jgi:transposase
MAKGYRPVDRDQPFLLPPDMREWLPGDHPVWLVIAAVEDHLDTSAFHARRRTGGAGAAGYDPDMLVTLLFWAYAQGVTSSRRIEAACWRDVAFRVICAGDVPDHVTIARFRAGFGGAVEELFSEVLVLCARLGMGKLGTIALDGTKIAASASRSANRSEETLRRLAAETVAAHAAADAAEDELYGPGARGDEVPAEVADPRSRAGRIAAALAELEAERQAAREQQERKGQGYLAAAAEGHQPGSVPLAVIVEAARGRLERAEAAQQAKIDAWHRRQQAEKAAGGPRRPGGARVPPAPVPDHFRVRRAQASLAKALARAAAAQRKDAGRKDQPARNITDRDSRLMPVRGGGFVQGYNAQNVTSSDKLIIATELTSDPNDAPWYEPMIAAAAAAAAAIIANQPSAPAGEGDNAPASARENGGDAGAAGHRDSDGEGDSSGIGLVLADAGYLSKDNLTASGPDRLIATGKRRKLERTARQAPAAGSSAGSQHDEEQPIAAMTARLATPEGITAYRQRGHIAETPHGHIKHNMGFRQLSVRGKAKASGEWRFACTVHNLFKAITTGHLTAAALAALAG